MFLGPSPRRTMDAALGANTRDHRRSHFRWPELRFQRSRHGTKSRRYRGVETTVARDSLGIGSMPARDQLVNDMDGWGMNEAGIATGTPTLGFPDEHHVSITGTALDAEIPGDPSDLLSRR